MHIIIATLLFATSFSYADLPKSFYKHEKKVEKRESEIEKDSERCFEGLPSTSSTDILHHGTRP